MVHLKVLVRAAAFGLAAYGVIAGLIYLSRQAGLLDWIR
jgi:hypothetical protein